MNRLFTRVYLPEDEEALAADPLLSSLDPERRRTLIARRDPDGGLTWDIRLQGDGETVFLDFERRRGCLQVTLRRSQPDGDAGLHGDVGLLSPVSASPLVAALTGDRAVLAAILEVEAAWAAVLERPAWPRPGPPRSWPPPRTCSRYDVADIAVRAQGGGNPVIPLLADLREQVKALDTAGLGAGAAPCTPR